MATVYDSGRIPVPVETVDSKFYIAHPVKILLIGDSSVGKTSAMIQFTDCLFSSSYISTIGIDFKVKTVLVGGRKVKLQIWDTAGQERFHTITASFYRSAMGIMLVYDITNPHSFANVNKWLRNIREHGKEDVKIMLVGNKCDLESDRMVSTEDGERVARENGLPFWEVSARTNLNIDKAFFGLAQEIVDEVASQNADLEDGIYLGNQGLNFQQGKPRSGCCGNFTPHDERLKYQIKGLINDWR